MAGNKYSAKEASMILGVSVRTIQRHVATLISDLTSADGRGIIISEDVLSLLKARQADDTTTTDGRQTSKDKLKDEILIEELFTPEEHEKFNSIIFTEYPVMKKQLEMTSESLQIQKEYIKGLEKQIEYFRFSYNKQLEIHEKLIDSFRERNFIEAKEKGLDDL